MIQFRKITFLTGLCFTLFACNNDQPIKNKEKPKSKLSELPAPFRHHEKIEVGPELIFDVYSWGRGSDSTSSVLVLRSDSLKNDFSIASSDNLDGRLKEVFNTDMDNDGNPEILIYYVENDKYQSAEILCYEFTGKNVNKISFPNLSSKTLKQYRGKDKFYVKEGKLFRELSLFEESDKEGKTVKEKKTVQYFIQGNKFDLTELE